LYLGLVVFAWALSAESYSGAITGTVTDWDGVPMAKAMVSARNASGAEFHCISATTGNYILDQLPPGTYQVSVFAEGLKPYQAADFVVAAGGAVRWDARLEDFQNLNTLGDGRDFIADILSKKHSVPAGPTPRLSSGRPDLSGVWLAQRPVDPGMPEMMPWAEALTNERQENHLKDWPSSRCLPYGVPLQGMFFPYRIVQTADIVAIVYEDDMPRQIHLDGRPHPKDWDATFVGHSVGRWEGDELVVDTVGFNEKTWVDFFGHPHTDKLHVIERYRRPDLGHLEIETTIDDPQTYRKPWNMRKTSELAPRSEEIGQFICAENNQDVPHLVGK
jgi:hypothetical protein